MSTKRKKITCLENEEFFWFSFILVPGNTSAVHELFSFATSGTKVTNKLKDLIGVLLSQRPM